MPIILPIIDHRSATEIGYRLAPNRSPDDLSTIPLKHRELAMETVLWVANHLLSLILGIGGAGALFAVRGVSPSHTNRSEERRREMFVPLTHPPGHAQVDFGEALAVIGGVERKIHFLAMSLPHSDACFVKAYPGETTEAFCDGHVSGFSFFGGVPRSILYDNTRIAVARILGDGKRQRTRVFSELRSHYLFEDRFGRPGKGNDKGKVEGIVGYCRRNFLVPMPRFRNFDDLNTHLEACCAKRWAEQLRGHDQTVGELLVTTVNFPFVTTQNFSLWACR